MPELSAELQRLKELFIVPNDAVVDLMKPKTRGVLTEKFYCPFAPCCSDCKGLFTFRETLHHLRRVHKKDVSEIKALVSHGLPVVPERGQQRRALPPPPQSSKS